VSRGLAAATAPSPGVAASNLTRSAALAAAAIGGLAGFVRFGLTSRGLVAAVLLGAMGALAVLDFRNQALPIPIVLPAAAVVLALQLVLFPSDALEWVLAAAITFGILLALSAARRDSLGMGDALVGFLLGAGLGADVAYAMLLGCLALWPVAAYIVFYEGADARKKAIPLTPALALGAAVVVLAG
jgi:prepilin signal peptidase PulO-like enzyme (type II secretory pathway)